MLRIFAIIFTIGLLISIALGTMVYTKFGFVIIEDGFGGVKKSGTTYLDEPLSQGYHFFIPVYQEIEVIEMRPRLINYSKTESKNKNTEQLIFKEVLSGLDKRGIKMKLAISIEVRPIASHLPKMFKEDGNFESGFYKKVLQANKNIVKDVMAEFEADTITENRVRFGLRLKEELAKQYSRTPYFELVEPNVKEIILPDDIIANQKAVQIAKQKTLKEKQVVKTKEAQAEQLVAIANGKAKSILIEAQAKADAQLIESEAKAKAFKLVSNSLTLKLLRLKEIEEWDGAQPLITGESKFLLNTDLEKLKGNRNIKGNQKVKAGNNIKINSKKEGK